MSCIEWEGCLTGSGYGNTWKGLAHRVAWEKVNGPIPAGMVVMHTCANRRCVNPDHLELGTQHENRLEMVKRGVNPKQKISFEDAELIRWCGAQGPKKYGWATAVAKIFGVTNGTIIRIRLGKTFREAEPSI